MSRRDKIHEAVRNALIKDGWTITADPFELEYEDAVLQADLAADRTLAAERAEEKIIESVAPERLLYLAIGQSVWEKLFKMRIAQKFLDRFPMRLLIINVQTEEIVLWKQ